jgi:sugar/nucleoside kinase (ribokinase family)
MNQLPEKGATVHSNFLKIATGGKGANRAVAASIYIDEQGDNSIIVYGGAKLKIPIAHESLADIQRQDVFAPES